MLKRLVLANEEGKGFRYIIDYAIEFYCEGKPFDLNKEMTDFVEDIYKELDKSKIEVYSHPDCFFCYCPTADYCKSIDGCKNAIVKGANLGNDAGTDSMGVNEI